MFRIIFTTIICLITTTSFAVETVNISKVPYHDTPNLHLRWSYSKLNKGWKRTIAIGIACES